MELVYGIKDKPSLGKVFLFAVQQLLAIMAATIAVLSLGAWLRNIFPMILLFISLMNDSSNFP